MQSPRAPQICSRAGLLLPGVTCGPVPVEPRLPQGQQRCLFLSLWASAWLFPANRPHFLAPRSLLWWDSAMWTAFKLYKEMSHAGHGRWFPFLPELAPVASEAGTSLPVTKSLPWFTRPGLHIRAQLSQNHLSLEMDTPPTQSLEEGTRHVSGRAPEPGSL